MGEKLPLATVQQAVLEFLRGRNDVVVFGAQAVNAYVQEPRMTQHVDLLAIRAEEISRMLGEELLRRFHIAVRVRTVAGGRGLRLFQVRKAGNRHLVDIRPVQTLPSAERVGGVLVMAPVELIASKVLAYQRRLGQPKSGTDWRDLALLLLAFPDLKSASGPVRDALVAGGATSEVLTVWEKLVEQEIRAATDEEDW